MSPATSSPVGRRPRPMPAPCRAGSTARSARPDRGAGSGTARRSRRATARAESTAPPRAAPSVLEAHRAGQAEQPAGVDARRAISGPDEKQWKITASGAPSARSTSRTSASASRLWIISGLPVRLARSMCHANASRCWAGSGAAVQFPRPVHVHAGLPDRDDPGMGGEPFDLGPGVVGERVGARRVQCHRGVDPRIPVGRLGDPPRRVEVVGDRHDGLDAHRLGAVEDCVDVVGVGRTAGVEVGVRVDERRQWLRRGWRVAAVIHSSRTQAKTIG